MNEVVSKLQNDLDNTNIDDYRIIKYSEDSDGTLIIAGSFDFCYYHDIEITFYGVAFISCPTDFCNARFSIASIEEALKLKNWFYDIYGKFVMRIIVDENSESRQNYYIVADRMEYKFVKVYYYKRDNLQEGERIADWVK